MIDQPHELKIIEFISHWHREQKRKFTGEPYVVHLKAVALTIKETVADRTMIAAAFCHDLYEDTPCTQQEFYIFLKELNFSNQEVDNTNKLVLELTDEYIKSNYPDLNRRKRKALEAQRLGNISPRAQTIKYADLIDNSKNLVNENAGFAKTYLGEMHQILKLMDKGNSSLFKRAQKKMKEQMSLLNS